MTDQEIVNQFDELCDNDLSQDLKIQLANNTKNKLERELKLEICKILNESNSTTVGQTYTTSISLPSGFRGLARKFIWRGTTKLHPKSLEEAPRWRDTSGYFYIDYKNSVLRLTGTQTTAETLSIPYIGKTDDISDSSVEAGTTTLTWPSEFHSLLAYEMVKMLDQIERLQESRSWRAEWDAEYQMLKNALISWDHDLKLAALDGQTPYGPDEPNLGIYQLDV